MSDLLSHSLATAWEQLTAPGAPYETRPLQAYGRAVIGYARAPADLAAVWESTTNLGDRVYLVFQEERLT